MYSPNKINQSMTAIYRMHNNIKSIVVECIGICYPYSTQ